MTILDLEKILNDKKEFRIFYRNNQDTLSANLNEFKIRIIDSKFYYLELREENFLFSISLEKEELTKKLDILDKANLRVFYLNLKNCQITVYLDK
ncbi:hypothetical protein [Fusobacterium sp.]|uniref:hypothetical protein n=1 Tax=Fusobacterium sp. TaxID=68766 RepID=UPI0026192529|nr:hypothetical protein [Fusobacterium sp.]